MLDILLADDELLVRTGIKMLLDWNSEGCRICGEAENGMEALEMAEKLKPHVILTDIQMPLMNGLELMKELKKRSFPGIVAVLSNHGDFQYAQEAIRCGAADYILKTDLNRENFLAFIRTLKQRIPPGDNGMRPDRVPRHGSHILKEILLNSSSGIRQKSLENLEHSWKELSYRPGILQIRQPMAGNEEKMTLLQITEGVARGSGIFFYDPGPEKNYWILLLYGKKEELTEQKIRAMEKRLRNALATYLSLPVFWGIGPLTDNLCYLNDAYLETEMVMWDSFFHSDSPLGFSENMKASIPEESPEWMDDFRLLISHSTTPEEKEQILTGVFLHLRRLKDAKTLKNLSLQFIAYLNRQKAGLAMEGSARSPRQLPLCSLWHISSLDELEKLFQDALKGIEDQAKCQPVNLISRCLAFIEANMSRPLSLQETAGQSGLSGSYFSSWFKEKTGENFSDYLIRKRMELARKLLESRPELRIYEIAAQCGIPNEKYFSRLFKTHTGLTPREYRKEMHQIGN